MSNVRRRARVLALLVIFGGLLALPGTASAEGSRLRTGEVDGLPFKVLLPTEYDAEPTKRYPVLYLVHPGGAGGDAYRNHWLERTDLAEFTAGEDVIVVLPDNDWLSFYVDARDGSCRGDTQFMKGLLPHIDSHFRTVADGRHRAIAGVAPGGFSAVHLAAWYPDTFAAVGTFSGEPDVLFGYDRLGGVAYTPIERAAVQSCGGDITGPGLYGYLPADEVWWRNSNPPDLAANLRTAALLYLSVGNGQPCDAHDVVDLAEADEGTGTHAFQLTEPIVEQGTKGLRTALDREGVAYESNMDRCGIHTWRYWQRDLHDFWPKMTTAFGEPAPGAFGYRRAEPTVSVWGWTFRADPNRAAEFLDIRDASRASLTLTGSGLTAITTAAVFRPNQRVLVSDGTRSRLVTAGRDGRLTVTVDLGPAHTVQQYSVGNETAESSPGYFTTRTITFGW